MHAHSPVDARLDTSITLAYTIFLLKWISPDKRWACLLLTSASRCVWNLLTHLTVTPWGLSGKHQPCTRRISFIIYYTTIHYYRGMYDGAPHVAVGLRQKGLNFPWHACKKLAHLFLGHIQKCH